MADAHPAADALARASEMITLSFNLGRPRADPPPCRYCRAVKRPERGRCPVCGAPVTERA